MSNLNKSAAKACGTPTVGYTLAIQTDGIHILPPDFWGVPIVCGEIHTFHQKDCLVICWACALEQKIVHESEEEHNELVKTFLQQLLE